jgi:perosamine synthetase
VPDILEIADRHDLPVIEDACEALGGTYDDRPAGSMGRAGVFAFYPNKQITTGEGGMIVTDDAELAGVARSLRNQGRDPDVPGWLSHPRFGYNYRIAEINCALGIAQVDRLDEILTARRRVVDLYHDRLAGDKRIVLQQVAPGVRMSPFVFVIRLRDDYTREDRDRILDALRERGIGCSNYFTPIHLQPPYRERFGHAEGDFPVCEALAARTVALPFHHALTEDDVATVCDALTELL